MIFDLIIFLTDDYWTDFIDTGFSNNWPIVISVTSCYDMKHNLSVSKKKANWTRHQ